MDTTYTTAQGDTWDTIARAAYGDEMKAQHLMQARANIQLLDYEVFPGGITVATPEIAPESIYDIDLPDWRRD